MAQGIMAHKLKIIQLGFLLLIIMLMINVYSTNPLINYIFLDINGKTVSTVNGNIYNYNELVNKGSVLYIEFQGFGNKKYEQISISLYSLNKYNYLKIHNIEFEFENKVKTVKINKTIKLDQYSSLFSVENNSDNDTMRWEEAIEPHLPIYVRQQRRSDELSILAYFQPISYKLNNIKIYTHRIFKKNKEDFDKNFDLTLKVFYSFDNNSDIVVQEIKYRVNIFEAKKWPPDWYYWLFYPR